MLKTRTWQVVYCYPFRTIFYLILDYLAEFVLPLAKSDEAVEISPQLEPFAKQDLSPRCFT